MTTRVKECTACLVATEINQEGTTCLNYYRNYLHLGKFRSELLIGTYRHELHLGQYRLVLHCEQLYVNKTIMTEPPAKDGLCFQSRFLWFVVCCDCMLMVIFILLIIKSSPCCGF